MFPTYSNRTFYLIGYEYRALICNHFFSFSVQRPHQIGGEHIDVKKALRKAEMVGQGPGGQTGSGGGGGGGGECNCYYCEIIPFVPDVVHSVNVTTYQK
jgi:hypothetical protein